MKNPILETLGSVEANPKAVFQINLDGRAWLLGSPCDEGRMSWEGFYRVNPNGNTYGPCVSVASGSWKATPESVLTYLAHQAVGSHPKKGQVAEIAATIRARLSVELVRIKP